MASCRGVANAAFSLKTVPPERPLVFHRWPPAHRRWPLESALSRIPPNLSMLEPAHSSPMIRCVRFVGGRISKLALGTSQLQPEIADFTLHHIRARSRRPVDGGLDFGELALRQRTSGHGGV